MDLQFDKVPCPHLQQVKWEVQSQEETQEVRIGDGMPDIGSVLGAGGQVLMRGKEWRSGSMQVSGGVMAWVLYQPEEGGVPQCVETWLPFQMRWDLPDTQHDGKICVHCMLRNVDARSTSARKLMVRTTVSVLAEALVPAETDVFTPCQLPEDIRLLKRTYPVQMPREAGEKPFSLEEELSLPGSCPKLKKLMRCVLQPELIDRKVMADKVVFRGGALVHILYLSQEDALCTWDFEVPFSQYAQLDAQYGQDATAQIIPAVTAMELDVDPEGRLLLKAGLTGQYVISDRTELELVEDAYSNRRAVRLQMGKLELPLILDHACQTVHAEQEIPLEGGRAVDASFYPIHPVVDCSAGDPQIRLAGQFQLLSYDENGMPQCATERWEDRWELPAVEDTGIHPWASCSGMPQVFLQPGQCTVRCDLTVDAQTMLRQGLSMVTGLEVDEAAEPDPQRPSLILRRCGGDSLWQIAKTCGSDVEIIQKANDLSDEPAPDRMLLIPVL